MASQAANEFLNKEIKVSNNVVTFRLLSRQLSIHVDEAKRELELFYAASRKSKEPVFATYLLTGIATPIPQSEPTTGALGQISSRHLIVLASEDELEVLRTKFVSTPSQYIHSLSSVPLKEYGVLTSVTERVRRIDLEKGQEHTGRLGMLLSNEAPWPVPGSSKSKVKRVAGEPAKSSVMATKSVGPVPLERASSKVATNNSPLAKAPLKKGTLSFSTVTKKVDVTSSKKEVKEAVKDTASTKAISSDKEMKSVSKKKSSTNLDDTSSTSKQPSPSSIKSTVSEPVQHAATTTAGRTKRILDSSDEDEQTAARPRPALKRKKSRATSNEDDASEHQSIGTRRRSASLQAMMDLDDDGVINGRSTRSVTPEHVPSAREAAAAAKAARAELTKGVDRKERGPRKRVPKGKKRVVKTRRVKNAKGYTVMEDYSSYEDVDPNEDDGGAETEPEDREKAEKKPDAPKPTGGKSNAQKTGSSAKPRAAESMSGGKKTKQSTDGKPGQQKLANFFGKK